MMRIQTFLSTIFFLIQNCLLLPQKINFRKKQTNKRSYLQSRNRCELSRKTKQAVQKMPISRIT